MSQGGKRDASWVADRVVAHLKADLPAKLTSLTTEYNDGITLANIPAANYVISERQKLPGFPMIAVIQDDTDISDDGEFRYHIERHRMTVAVALMDNIDEDNLVRRTHRTLRGIEEVFLDDRTLNGSVVDVRCLNKSYASLMAAGNGLLKEGQLEIEAMTSIP
jgi:hypothetical protein